MVIGVNTQSTSAGTVRIPITRMHSTILYTSDRFALKKQVLALKPPVALTGKGSDLLGALTQACRYASQMQTTHRIVVISLSDLLAQGTHGESLITTSAQKRADDAAAIGTFPTGAEGAFLYVDTPQYNAVSDYWHAVLTTAGVNVSPLP